ncbi:MAG TPA: hypothetical protein ENK87_04245 [Nitratifractor sp.]|nr:hypothetical protein [Nitratifractor sp.]HHD74595.1 hypothetical protein [Nitratifractor sp.]HHH21114.1 hypothetical protein [Nitratifractor sp.]
MRRIFFLFVVTLFLAGCTSVHYNTLHEQSDRAPIESLGKILEEISKDKQESKELATLAVTYSKVLANRYDLVSPPSYHNFLVNTGEREKGLCYDFVDDLMVEIRSRHFKSFQFKWGRANADALNEHNVIVVLSKGVPFQDGVVLDAWRHSGKLYFVKVKDDPKYRFREWIEGDKRVAQ